MKLNKLASIAFLSMMISISFADPLLTQPAPGTKAPDFALSSGEGHQVNLKDYRGQWVVLYFYPKDFTGGCTLEAHNFQQDLAKYNSLHAVILGVSVDTADSHKSFCAKEGLAFKLLADTDAKVATTYGSVMTHEGKTYAARNTFIINPKGEVAKVFLKVNPTTHSSAVLDALTQLQKGS